MAALERRRRAPLAARAQPTAQQLAPPGSIAIPLTRGWVTWVDADVFADVSQKTWTAGGNEHSMSALRREYPNGRESDGVNVAMHRYITGCPDGLEVDHVDRHDAIKVIDNRRTNLRVCTRTENARNLPIRQNKTGVVTSRFKGVVWCRRYWLARIAIPGTKKNRHLGCFSRDREHYGALAYDYAARGAFGAFARTNFPAVEGPVPVEI